MSLTVAELEEKIAKAKKDIEQARIAADSPRKVEVLNEYIEMLEEDLFNAKQSNKKT
jgi:predicted ribosome quality control (RQC) complex YloA/Tae2 family protein